MGTLPADLAPPLRNPWFADSPQEGDGFEPSVPGTKEPVFVAEGELRDRTGAAKKGCSLCGTDGSNPSPSSGESDEPPNPATAEGSSPPNRPFKVSSGDADMTAVRQARRFAAWS